MKGFTLVELVVVIAVLMIMAAVSAPRFTGTETFDTRGTLGQILTTLRYAQKTAIAQHRSVYVQLDAVNKTLKLCYSNTCNSLLRDPVTNGNFSLALNSRVLVTPSVITLGFAVDGTPIPNATATYTVKNSKNLAQTSTIVVEANTGYVHKQ